jgi:hypothetical protein
MSEWPATLGGGNTNPSPVAVDFGQGEGEATIRRGYLSDLERKDRQAKNLPDPAFDDLLNRLQIAGGYIGRDMEDGAHETRDNANAENFRYLPSFHHQESSGVVPDRFRAGKESLSVVRNVTVRDSKRTKARSKDDDYKRRVSISPSTLAVPADRSPAGLVLPHRHLRVEEDVSGIGTRGNFYSKIENGNSSAGAPGIFSSPNSEPGRRGFYGGPFDGGLSPVIASGGGIRPASPREGGNFDITLSYEGTRVQHQVSENMAVEQLTGEAAKIFRLNAPEVVLLLYGMIPRTLPRGGRISDSPRVVPGSTILVFYVIVPRNPQGINQYHHNKVVGGTIQPEHNSRQPLLGRRF